MGAAVVVLPSIAQSETTPTITAYNEPFYEHHYWTPSAATVNASGNVAFTNPTEVNHGVEWKSVPATPSCSAGVPVGSNELAAGKNWSGTCTFTQPGKYEFWCTVHHKEMSGVITVNANGTTTTTSTSGTTTVPGGGSSTNTTTITVPGPQGGSGASGSPLAGSAPEAIKLPSSQRGKAVRGSVAISPAGAGGRLEVDLLVKSAALASAGHAAQVRVGRVVRTALQAGKISFSVPLNVRARRALKRHRHLPLSVQVIVTRVSGSAVTIVRRVVVHA